MSDPHYKIVRWTNAVREESGTYFVGRNGYGNCNGVELETLHGSLKTYIRPITGKGKVGRCVIALPDCPEVIREVAEQLLLVAGKGEEPKDRGNAKYVYAVVRVGVKDGVNPVDALNEADYSFRHPDILETEIIDVRDCPEG